LGNYNLSSLKGEKMKKFCMFLVLFLSCDYVEDKYVDFHKEVGESMAVYVSNFCVDNMKRTYNGNAEECIDNEWIIVDSDTE
jgi:hypothetical protein